MILNWKQSKLILKIRNFLKTNNKKLDVTFDDYLTRKENFMKVLNNQLKNKFEYSDQVFHMINKIVNIVIGKSNNSF